MTSETLTILAVIVGIVFFIIGILYSLYLENRFINKHAVALTVTEVRGEFSYNDTWIRNVIHDCLVEEKRGTLTDNILKVKDMEKWVRIWGRYTYYRKTIS